MKAITGRLQRRFVELREQKQTEQTPSYFWCRDWGSSDRMFSQISGPASRLSVGRPTLPRKLKISELSQLRDLFLNCDSVQDPAKRNDIILQLRPEIANNIARGRDANTDLVNTINTSRNYPGGLAELLYGIEFFEQGSLAVRDLRQAIAQMLPDEISV